MQTVTVVRGVDDESNDQILPRFSRTRDANLAIFSATPVCLTSIAFTRDSNAPRGTT